MSMLKVEKVVKVLRNPMVMVRRSAGAIDSEVVPVSNPNAVEFITFMVRVPTKPGWFVQVFIMWPML